MKEGILKDILPGKIIRAYSDPSHDLRYECLQSLPLKTGFVVGTIWECGESKPDIYFLIVLSTKKKNKIPE